MTRDRRAAGPLLSRKGDARPLAEPAVRVCRPPHGRRVGATLATELYVRFKAHVAREGITGEQAIAAAIELLLDDCRPIGVGRVLGPRASARRLLE
jgi:hypothetical protein